MTRVMITGGFGFIGTNLVKHWLRKHPQDDVILVDAETYAADSSGVLDSFGDSEKLFIERMDIRDQALVARVLQRYSPDIIFHLAAESHVCRSISGPKEFMTTNIMGTWNLLEEWRMLHRCDITKRFVHVSTDEVFGELEHWEPPFHEASPVRPRSPYAASKASSDLIALAYYETYGLPVVVTNCSNNFGPHQHPEKLIPATIRRLLNGEPAVLFGSGEQVRDWLFVDDHVEALELVLQKGMSGNRYVIGGECEKTNLDVVEKVHFIMTELGLINIPFHVEHDDDARPTDDQRYAIDNSAMRALGWEPTNGDFMTRLIETVRWYADKGGRNAI